MEDEQLYIHVAKLTRLKFLLKSKFQTHLENRIRFNCIQPDLGPFPAAKNLSPVIWVTCSLRERRVCFRPRLRVERRLKPFGDVYLLQKLPRNGKIVCQRCPVCFERGVSRRRLFVHSRNLKDNTYIRADLPCARR